MLGKALVNNLDITNGVYVSPLSRARDTLSLIRTVHHNFGRPETVLKDLREIDFFDWEGKVKDELIAEYPDSWQAWESGQAQNLLVPDSSNPNKLSNRYPLVELWVRADDVWKTILKLEEEEYTETSDQGTTENEDTVRSSVLVCHGTLGQALLATSFKEDISFFGQHVFPNCGMVEIEWIIEKKSQGHKFQEKAAKWRWFQCIVGWFSPV